MVTSFRPTHGHIPQVHPEGRILQVYSDCNILQIHPEHERSYLGTLILFKELQCFEFLKEQFIVLF